MFEKEIKTRKIIHVDMDCFYAAIEVRDNPQLRNLPVAVGGSSDRRGVICACNYAARKYGIHSAMSSVKAFKLCPNLVLLPVNMQKYKDASQIIRKIFYQYTDLVEPLSLDEAYLDVTDCKEFSGSATWMALNIRKQIYDACSVTASAGIAPNKFLAKVASDWEKPNGQLVIPPQNIQSFVSKLKVEKIMGVGKVTAAKLHRHGIYNCNQLHQKSLIYLHEHFGVFGKRLFELSKGYDTREVQSCRQRKSLSVEETFVTDLHTTAQGIAELEHLYKKLLSRLVKENNKKITKQFIKIKFNDFNLKTVEKVTNNLSCDLFKQLFTQGLAIRKKPYRLLGMGVRFETKKENNYQLSLFD